METNTPHPLWKFKKLTAVHIELSTKCNAACPGCARFTMNSPIIDNRLILTDITFDNFRTWFPENLISNIYNWIICGNLGDPMACKDVYKITEYIAKNSPGNIQINTNGGLRSKGLYKQIGDLFVNHNTGNRNITFSIDGLADTNHIYRRNVDWTKVWNNLMSYVSTGARAHWDFLHFKHNSHQVDEARRLAEKYGINFVLKNPFGVDGTAMPVYNKNLKFDYNIEHHTLNQFPSYTPAGPDYVAEFPTKIKAEGVIHCMSKRGSPSDQYEILEIYVDALGRVFPCCFVGNRMFIRHMSDAIQVQQLQESIGDKNNLHQYSLEEIFKNGVLDHYSKSWNNKSIAVCWNQCGKNTSKERHIDNLLKDAQ